MLFRFTVYFPLRSTMTVQLAGPTRGSAGLPGPVRSHLIRKEQKLAKQPGQRQLAPLFRDDDGLKVSSPVTTRTMNSDCV